MARVSTAIIGTGFMGRVHAEQIRRLGFVDIAGVASINAAEAAAFGSDQPKALPFQVLDYASGFLMAFVAQVAMLRQREEGGSWHARVSLAQTGHWLRSLGQARIETRPDPLADWKSHLVRWPSNFGALQAFPHAGRLSGKGADAIEAPGATASRASVRPGTDKPVWL